MSIRYAKKYNSYLRKMFLSFFANRNIEISDI